MHEILIIDDQDSIRSGLKQVLLRRGYSVSTADTADAAWPIIENRIFDCIICDLRMDGMSGLELAQKLKNSSYPAGFILISAYLSIEDVLQALRLGVCDVFNKPFKNSDIAEKLDQIFSSKPGKEKNRKPTGNMRLMRSCFEEFHALNYYSGLNNAFRLFVYNTHDSVQRIVVTRPLFENESLYMDGFFAMLNETGHKLSQLHEIFVRFRLSSKLPERGFVILEPDFRSGSLAYASFGDIGFALISPLVSENEKEVMVVTDKSGVLELDHSWFIIFMNKDCLKNLQDKNKGHTAAFEFNGSWTSVSEKFLDFAGIEGLNSKTPAMMLYGGFFSPSLNVFRYETRFPFPDIKNQSSSLVLFLESMNVSAMLIARLVCFYYEVLYGLLKSGYEHAVNISFTAQKNEKITAEFSGAEIGDKGMCDFRNAADDMQDIFSNPGFGLIQELRNSFVAFSDHKIIYEVFLSDKKNM